MSVRDRGLIPVPKLISIITVNNYLKQQLSILLENLYFKQMVGVCGVSIFNYLSKLPLLGFPLERSLYRHLFETTILIRTSLTPAFIFTQYEDN